MSEEIYFKLIATLYGILQTVGLGILSWLSVSIIRQNRQIAELTVTVRDVVVSTLDEHKQRHNRASERLGSLENRVTRIEASAPRKDH